MGANEIEVPYLVGFVRTISDYYPLSEIMTSPMKWGSSGIYWAGFRLCLCLCLELITLTVHLWEIWKRSPHHLCCCWSCFFDNIINISNTFFFAARAYIKMTIIDFPKHRWGLLFNWPNLETSWTSLILSKPWSMICSSVGKSYIYNNTMRLWPHYFPTPWQLYPWGFLISLLIDPLWFGQFWVHQPFPTWSQLKRCESSSVSCAPSTCGMTSLGVKRYWNLPVSFLQTWCVRYDWKEFPIVYP